MRLKAKAYAKLNLFLDVVGKREDGYHDIDSVMQSISLYDVIEISERTDEVVSIKYQDPSFFRENDVINRAFEVFSKFSGYKKGVDIFIEKNIPTFSGLGGYSSDLATVLKLLNKLSEKNYSDTEMLPLCASLGADVPFCYNGGTARTKGIGELIEPLKTTEFSVVLLKEEEKQSTAKMYQTLDTLGTVPSDSLQRMLIGLEVKDSKQILDSTYNVFEKCWDMDRMSSPFKDYLPDSIFLSGSGPTVVAAFCDNDSAKKCYEELKNNGKNVFFATTVDRKNIIE